MADQFLVDFLTTELNGYVRLHGKAFNDTNSPLIPEGEEGFILTIRQSPRDIKEVVADFYHRQGFTTKMHLGAVHVQKNGITVKYVVITGGEGRTIFSVKRLR